MPRLRLHPLLCALPLIGSVLAEPLPSSAPQPADNPSTPAKIELGRRLYFDPRLSADGTVSCNSCHDLDKGGVDGLPVSLGVTGKMGGRNAPTVWNAAFNSTQFWDGRAATLEEQAQGPVTNPVEMAMPGGEAVADRLKAIPDYLAAFARAFPDDPQPSLRNAGRAIAAFERTLITPGSAYDRHEQGDKTALSAQQQRGLATFTEVGCVACHSGPAFNGPQASLPPGTGFYQRFPTYTDSLLVARYALDQDPGRYAVTHNEADRHMFKVPTLRNVALTAPYFHTGSVPTLPEAVRVMGKVQLDRDLTEQQVEDIVAFLGALTGPFPRIERPPVPREVSLHQRAPFLAQE
ncbi:cytochrome-c peroxidase [Immundisolibacter sp.]|uniref:cytochrome-c peroxidase n=1 Tax=Immundisolibacter sp. TaxID=1934948 RepID=UPI00260A5D13|nr:cytochrome-c peroxidase [Immundisolibacter sp.]MDD3652090.1 cytochrome-c peroxidase [Immundisolibacter sp.]